MNTFRNNTLFITAISLCIVISSFQHVQAQNGYVKLFDGKTLKGWKRLAGKAEYKVVNGIIEGTAVADSANTFLVTEKEYGDYILELDVKMDNPAGNSGVQIRSHYDPAGHKGKGLVYGKQFEIDPSDRKWSGGIYDEGRRDWLYPLELNAKAKDAFKLGEYNHVKMECIGNEVKTWINGVPAAYVVDTLDRTGFIALQVHGIYRANQEGSKIYFKNIRIKTKGLVAQSFPKGIYVANLQPNTLNAYEKQDGWKLLFDGKTSKGWRSVRDLNFPTKGWDTNDGYLTIQGAPNKSSQIGGDIITEERYGPMDLSFDFRMTEVANGGLKYFTTLSQGTTGAPLGLEYQVLDDQKHPDARAGRNGNRKLGSLYDLIPATKQARFVKRIGQWNTARIVVYPNNHVEHYLNGVKVLEYDRGGAAYKEAVALSKFKNDANFGEATDGYILLQDHGCRVNFRNIKVKRL